ncbi:MAG: hypothetical protein IJR01_03970 [Bacteroidales bacterium]|nr:hypothetical protein [Bacteroidales bacterium]
MKNSKSESSKWLEAYLARHTGVTIYDIDSDEYQPIKNFTWIWNIFENKFFKRRCTAKELYEAAHLTLDNTIADETFNLFKDRYASDNNVNDKFSSLLLDEGYKDGVKRILCSDNPTIEEKNKACRMIIQRLRNNLFHGNKEVGNLINQTELFKIVDNYLINLIDTVTKPNTVPAQSN